MKPEKVYYQKNFPVAQFIFETIGMGITLEEGDDTEDAINEAKRLVHEYHYKNQQQTGSAPASITQFANDNSSPEPDKIKRTMTISKEEKERERVDNIVRQIKEITDGTVLKTFEKLAMAHPETLSAYNLIAMEIESKKTGKL